MNKLIVSIVNSSDAPLTIFGRNRICVPGSGNTQVELPNNSQARALLARLQREYPFLTIQTVEPESLAVHAHSATPQGKASTPEAEKKEPAAPQDKSDSGSSGKSKNTPKTEATAE